MNKTHKGRESLLSKDFTKTQLCSSSLPPPSRLVIFLLALQYLIIARRHLTVIKPPSMNHLLRIWEMTPCSPQPEETWEHTGLCILGKCFNHKCSAQIGAITSHPESAAGRAYEKKKKEVSGCAEMGGSGDLSFGKNGFLFLLDILFRVSQSGASQPLCVIVRQTNPTLWSVPLGCFMGSGVVWPVYPPLNPLFAALGKQVVLTRLWILLS